ncbi:MAG: spermidine synthase [Alteromonadaceae bacterium]|jgi:spermidine synthase
METLMPVKKQLLFHDVILIGIMAILAACGLIYEYLLSHYAGRVLGAVETAIYAMIGIMIVSMGLGAFAARWCKQPFTAFAWLEAIIALIGMSAVLVIASLLALTGTLPQLLTSVFNLPPGTVLDGMLMLQLQEAATYTPYFAGFLLGFLIGMEIPLIARIRQEIYGTYLENNTGTIYGADYIGAGVGAAIWVTFMLSMDITKAAALTALLNVLAGSLFLWRYFDKVQWRKTLAGFHVLLLGGLLLLGLNGQLWMAQFTNVLYKDQVIYSAQSNYQHIAVTERYDAVDQQPVLDLYLNGRLQFSSADEHVYHSMLVYPAMAASRRHDNVLLIGGGDGLALRDVLKWQPQQVTLIDLDPQLVSLFSPLAELQSADSTHDRINQQMTHLNQNAFNDPRVNVIFGDAFIEINSLIKDGLKFDTIIIDLPDPNHPDLNKLYSDFFYQKVGQVLQGDGVMVVQSTSPFHAKKAFMSIGKTVNAAGFAHTEQYRQNVPSFGEWGWTIATKAGQSASARIKSLAQLPLEDDWVTQPLILGAFAFPNSFYNNINEIKINTLGSLVLYQYHYQAWKKDQGLYFKP